MTDDSVPSADPARHLQPPPLPLAGATTDVPALPAQAISPRRARWPTAAAWLVIAAMTGLIAVGQSMRDDGKDKQDGAHSKPDESASFVMELQARYIVGAAAFAPQQKATMLKQAKDIAAGPVDQRMRYVTLAGELSGPEAALAALDELAADMQTGQIEPTDEQAATRDALRRVYQQRIDQPEAATAEQADRDLLTNRLGWYGQLALHPAGTDQAERNAVLDPAVRVFVTMFGGVLVLMLAGLLGMAGLIGLGVAFGTKFLRPSLEIPTGHGGIYAETFAVWLVLFLGMSLAPALFSGRVDFSRYGLLFNLALSFLSLLALAWPVLRGVPWRQVRADIGWNAGRRPLLEPICGLASYAMLLPLLGIGMAITLLLISRHQAAVGTGFEPTNMPSHPIVPLLANSNFWTKVQVLLLAAVAAPIVEETMFRGVLYRHLRDAWSPWGFWASAAASAAVSSFVFAVIHPQGLLVVPALMAIAVGLCVAREWRGTLVPGMVAHGLHNGLLMTMLILFSKQA
ncbi:MAG: lysostaphin resistance A-like protein [Pirellulales bacterium]